MCFHVKMVICEIGVYTIHVFGEWVSSQCLHLVSQKSLMGDSGAITVFIRRFACHCIVVSSHEYVIS